MLKVLPSKTKGAGRGVFASKNIKKGEIVDVSPIIEIPRTEIENVEKSILVTYLFYFGKKKERAIIALGFGSLFNHSNNPSAKYEINFKDNVLNFLATRNIKKNEEITINYKGDSKNPRLLWFETIKSKGS